MSHHRKKAPVEPKKKHVIHVDLTAEDDEEEPLDATQLCKKLGLENQRDTKSQIKSEKVYKLTSIIGEGTYGVVHRGVDTRSNRLVAVKQMDLDPEDQGLPSVALREIAHLGQMCHKNIVNMLDLVMGEKHMMVIFEHLDMDLRQFQTQHTKKTKYLPFDMVRRITYQMLQGLAYIHSCSVIHRDMKPQNVLVDAKTLAVKISDFGLARVYTTPLHEMTVEVVTLWYRAPELLLGSELYTTSTDVWSLGVMIIELLENVCPFDPDSEIRALHMIFEALGTPTSQTWSDFPNLRHHSDAFPKWTRKSWKEISPHANAVAANLIEKMLVYDPAGRISCADAMEHQLFDRQYGGEIRNVEEMKSSRNTPQSPLSPQTPISFKSAQAAKTDSSDSHSQKQVAGPSRRLTNHIRPPTHGL